VVTCGCVSLATYGCASLFLLRFPWLVHRRRRDTENFQATRSVAHRGGRTKTPENTLESFAHAASLGIDAVELDVWLTADEEVAVQHDGEINGSTGNAHICTSDSRDLPPGLPLLRQVLEHLQLSPDIRVFIEIKQDGHPNATPATQRKLCDKILTSCTDTCMMQRAAWFKMNGNKPLHAASTCLLQTQRELPYALPTCSSRGDAILVHVLFFTGLLPCMPNRLLPSILLVHHRQKGRWQKYLFRHLQSRGIWVGALGVNEGLALASCRSLEVNFVATDDPDWLVGQPGWGPQDRDKSAPRGMSS